MEQLYPEWQWEAHYIDGTILYQDDNRIKDICFEKLASFRMVHKEKDPLILMWRPHLKLIHFYRVTTAYGMGGQGSETYRLYCFGYENEDGTGKNIFVIMPDGGIVLTDDVSKIRVKL
jgi:hypothetical protein